MLELNFERGKLDGIAYGSTVHPARPSAGSNLALFANPVDLGLKDLRWALRPDLWLHFEGSRRVRL